MCKDSEGHGGHCGGWTVVLALLPIDSDVFFEELLDARPRSKEAIIASVSHAWEAREHPDPCGHQLEQVVSHAALFVAAFAAEVWLFFDYVSLFQFKRQKEAEERSFRRSMGNMHAMYSHESTMTFRIEDLTPEHRWQKAIQDSSTVTILLWQMWTSWTSSFAPPHKKPERLLGAWMVPCWSELVVGARWHSATPENWCATHREGEI